MFENQIEACMLFLDTYYTETHEWIKVDKNVGTIGITDFAQVRISL